MVQLDEKGHLGVRPLRQQGDVLRRSAVILDPHLIWLEAVEGVLNRVGVEVAGKATKVEQALSLVAELQVDLFVMDVAVGYGEIDGLRCLELARECSPGTKCVVLSMEIDPERINATLAAGAVAYVFKSAHPDDLASAVRQTFDHSVYLARSPEPVQFSGARAIDRHAPQQLDDLTNREREILRLVAEGHSNAQLARMLWITEQTVKFHLSNVYRKLNVSNRTEAARWAQLHGLLPPVSAAV